MATAQRRKPVPRTIDDITRDLRDITGRLTNPHDPAQGQAIDRLRREAEAHLTKPPEQREKEGITPEQTERLRQALRELNTRVNNIQHGIPPQQRQAAPTRIYNYDVTIGNGPLQHTYRVTLRSPLPIGREREMLLDMARNHEFFDAGSSGQARVTTPNNPAERAEVTQLTGPGTQEFNNMQNNGRVDNFEAALNRAGPNAAVTVATIPVSQTTRRGG
jgi:hypothetical protein